MTTAPLPSHQVHPNPLVTGAGSDALGSEDAVLRDVVLDQVLDLTDVDASRIGVTVTAGAVTLRGEVDDHAGRARLLQTVEDAPGVTSLLHAVLVRPDDATGRTGLDPAALLPRQEHGVVRARVHLRDLDREDVVRWQEQSAAAARAPGVRAGAVRLADDVADELAASPASTDEVPPRITVVSQAGRVRLEGTVDSELQRRHAVSVCLSVPGVQDVENHLRVEPLAP